MQFQVSPSLDSRIWVSVVFLARINYASDCNSRRTLEAFSQRIFAFGLLSFSTRHYTVRVSAIVGPCDFPPPPVLVVVSASSLSRDYVNRPTRQKSPRCDDDDDDDRVRWCRRWEVCVCTSAAFGHSSLRQCVYPIVQFINESSGGCPTAADAAAASALDKPTTSPLRLLQRDSFIGGFTSSGRRLIGGDRWMHAISQK